MEQFRWTSPRLISCLYNSNADWVAPTARISPDKSCGTGEPACKIKSMTATTVTGGCGTIPRKETGTMPGRISQRAIKFCLWTLTWSIIRVKHRNMCDAPTNGISRAPDTRWDNFRDNLGYILKYSRKLNLANVMPHNTLSSTGYCLAQTPASGAEYLVYSPSGGQFHIGSFCYAELKQVVR